MFQASSNGLSELVNNISSAVVGMVYNTQLMKYAGEDGVAAYGVLMYVSMLFFAVYLGYAIGVAPVVGYHYGAENSAELRNVFRKSLKIILICSVGMVWCKGLRYFLCPHLHFSCHCKKVDVYRKVRTCPGFHLLFFCESKIYFLKNK